MTALTPTQDVLERAAETIKRGGVVVMPTETVYGLACDALNAEAVRKVFEIKGRPAENPLIVHVASVEEAEGIAERFPDEARRLAERFWPGPLTLVLEKRDTVPSETTADLGTVAVRMPDHPVALDLIRKAGCPVAAPSANPFMALSPTTADAIDESISLDVEIIIDGGPCRVGLESTVVDLSGDFPRILRPGGVSRAQVQAVLGRPLGHLPPETVRRSPGLYLRHYAPNAKVEVVDAAPEGRPALVFGDARSDQVKMPREPRAYAAQLYASLRHLDRKGHEVIYVEAPPDGAEWEAIHDRLKKASS